MIVRGVFIVAFVLVASGNVMGVTSTDIIQLFEKVEQAIISPRNPSLEQTEAAETVVGIVHNNRDKLDEVLPSDSLTRVFQWIRCAHASIRSSGWEIMEVLAEDDKYSEEAVKEGIIFDILNKIKIATGEEERFIFCTLRTLISMGKYIDNSELLSKDIIPLLKSQVAHEESSVAIGGVKSFYWILISNGKSMSEYLFDSGVAQVIIEQLSKQWELDTELLDVVRLMASHSKDLKVKIAELDFMSRINESLRKQKRSGYYNSFLQRSFITLSKLVEDSMEASELLIKQGLSLLVIKGLSNPDCIVKNGAMMVLYEIVKLGEPLEQLKSIHHGGFYAIRSRLCSEYENIMTKVGTDHREKFKTVFQTFDPKNQIFHLMMSSVHSRE